LTEQAPEFVDASDGQHRLSLSQSGVEFVLSKINANEVVADGEPEAAVDINDDQASQLRSAKTGVLSLDMPGADYGAVNYELLDVINSEAQSAPDVGNVWVRVTNKLSAIDIDARLAGNYFHMLMECLPKDRRSFTDDELAAIAQSLNDFTVQGLVLKKLVDIGKSLMQLFTASDLYRTMQLARTVLREWPCYKLEGNLVENRPDLLIEDENGNWLIVDFKTDNILQEQELQQQLHLHRRQLEGYKSDLKRIANIEADAAIYFARLGRLYQ
jgi:ATP-dependent exoDNAse (exonuclease V) beta subunit